MGSESQLKPNTKFSCASCGKLIKLDMKRNCPSWCKTCVKKLTTSGFGSIVPKNQPAGLTSQK